MPRKCENEECNNVVVKRVSYTAIVSKEAYDQYQQLQPKYKKKAEKAFDKFFIDDQARASMDLKKLAEIADKDQIIMYYSLRIDHDYRAALLFYEPDSTTEQAQVFCIDILTHADYDKWTKRI